eukprot:TRINITY_DN83_c0_g2_i1.p1 TRINITY_DN83_c0_g2~~TRINITY_DN83_c0_g2_i1.p1  ORF type:complete len:226 (+),score=92.30 TRINITY_DN83_c0_g2_i1:51-680(+)
MPELNNLNLYYCALKGVPTVKKEKTQDKVEQVKEQVEKVAESSGLAAVLEGAKELAKNAVETAKSVVEAVKEAVKPAAKDEDDIDLFGDDEDDAEHQAEISRIAAEAAARKNASGKKKEALKSAVVVDVKPWDDSTDMAALEKLIREQVILDGLEWKASKLTAIGYGIKKLQISCHIEDEKVSVDDIQEKIEAFEDYVQSTDIDSFTKL